EVHLVGLGAAAVLLRVGQAEQARPAEGADQLARELAARLEVGGPGCELGVGDLAGELEQRGRLVGGQDPLDVGGSTHRTTSSVGRVLRRSTPNSVQTTMSSIRAP